jgi:hypothetical protein
LGSIGSLAAQGQQGNAWQGPYPGVLQRERVGDQFAKAKGDKALVSLSPFPPPNPPHPGTPPGKKRLRQHRKRNRVLEGSFLLESRDPHGNLTEN